MPSAARRRCVQKRLAATLIIMCGRITSTASPEEIAETYRVAHPPATHDLVLARYNIAPTQPVIVVRSPEAGREMIVMRWGLVPRWAKDMSIGSRMINARAETLIEKPAFRDAFRKRRCLIPVTGFYEWAEVSRDKKQPYLIRMRGGKLFALAGLWEEWMPPDGGAMLQTFTIVTTEANEAIRPFHHRMPVILSREHVDIWLNPASDDCSLLKLLRPCPAEWLETIAVSPLVNNPRNDSPDCLRPATDDRK